SLALRHPPGGRRRSGDGGRRGTHSRSIRRARTSGHSRGRSAATGDAGNRQDQGGLQALRQGNGNYPGAVPRVDRKQDPHATTYDPRGDGEPGSLHGVRSGERDDWNYRQLEHGELGRLARESCESCVTSLAGQKGYERFMNNQTFTTTFSVEQTAQEALAAIKNVRGWWSVEIEGGADELGDEFTYRYQDVHYCKMKLIEVVPDKKLVWLVLDNFFNFTEDKSEWKGTR